MTDTAGGAIARARAIAPTGDIVDLIGVAATRMKQRGRQRRGIEIDVSASGAGSLPHRRVQTMRCGREMGFKDNPPDRSCLRWFPS